jgi:hypothetical protein
MPEKKYLEEIEEILKRSEDKAPPPGPRWTFSFPGRLPRMRFPRPAGLTRLSPDKFLIGGVVALILAMIFRFVMAPLIWTGLGLFVVAYIFYLVKPGRPRYEKKWRGRPIEDDPRTTSFWDRIRRFFKGS